MVCKLVVHQTNMGEVMAEPGGNAREQAREATTADGSTSTRKLHVLLGIQMNIVALHTRVDTSFTSPFLIAIYDDRAYYNQN